MRNAFNWVFAQPKIITFGRKTHIVLKKNFPI